MTPPNEPIIKQALGSDWDRLDPVVRRHYDLAPGTDQQVAMSGTMHDIDHSWIAKLFLLAGRMFGALVPYRGKDIPTTVRNWTTRDDGRNLFWHRTFTFPDGQQAIFTSRMMYLGGHELIEYVRFGLGIRMTMSVLNGSLVYKSIGYQWDIGRMSLRFPTWLLLGSGEITESGRSDTEFGMDFQMRHPWFGRTYSYSGRFVLDEHAERS